MDGSTIITSAVVAGVVTLGIEYAAKPWLEARKERILERQRLRREAATTLALAHAAWGQMVDFQKSLDLADLPEGYPAVAAGHAGRLKSQVHQQVIELSQASRLLYRASDPVLYRFLLSTVGLIEGTTAKGRMDDQAASDIDESVDVALVLLRKSPRSRKGRAARLEAQRRLDASL